MLANDPPPLIGALVRRPMEVVHLRILREAAEAGFTDLVPWRLLGLSPEDVGGLAVDFGEEVFDYERGGPSS
jgi:hypothetical protein